MSAGTQADAASDGETGTAHLQDRGGAGITQLQRAANDMVSEGNRSPKLTRMNQNFRAGVPQLYLDIDRTKALAYNVPLERLFTAVGTSFGSAYVNDFNLFGRTWRVMVQADQQFRSRLTDINRLEVRGACAEHRCALPRGETPHAVAHLSDHCPLVLEL